MRPDEGLLAELQGTFTGSAIGPTSIGLWKGTWNGQGDVTYAEATARFTKVPGSETVLGAPVLTPEIGGIVAAWDQEEFNVPGETANGYYVSIVIGGSPVLFAVERDPNQRDLDNTYRVTPSMRRRNV